MLSLAKAFNRDFRDAFMLLSVVIPVLNEAKTIPLMLSRLHDTLCQVTWEVDSCPRVPVTRDDGGGSRSRTEDISSCRPRAGMRG
jgi:hypothetical protein